MHTCRGKAHQHPCSSEQGHVPLRLCTDPMSFSLYRPSPAYRGAHKALLVLNLAQKYPQLYRAIGPTELENLHQKLLQKEQAPSSEACVQGMKPSQPPHRSAAVTVMQKTRKAARNDKPDPGLSAIRHSQRCISIAASPPHADRGRSYLFTEIHRCLF